MIKKPLQKLTKTANKFEILLKKEKLEKIDLEGLTAAEKSEFNGDYIIKNLLELKDQELQNFTEKVSAILSDDTKNQLWHRNHFIIIHAISKFVESSGMMPTANNLVGETGLSRQTVYKHMKEYASSSHYAERAIGFRIMTDRVLSKVLKIAVEGEGGVKAARLYSEAMGSLSNQNNVPANIKTQNNYIQINGTILSQDNLKNLNPEQLNQIESFIKLALPGEAI